ncbi:type II toxin-antitoxin system YoeB family toxin [Pseudooceanicola sp.]|uniref:type II toxin-antitoxin system YoeB family toxin n=1 Tax=Pseudooceanicola sp. TaxID=1914328 RepID=UPI003514A67B
MNHLIRATRRQPFTGIGTPEPLRGARGNCWLRRITGETRFGHRLKGNDQMQSLEVARLRDHY